MTQVRISSAGSNNEGAWSTYSDGSSIKWVASKNITIAESADGVTTVYQGRQGI